MSSEELPADGHREGPGETSWVLETKHEYG